MVGEWDSGLLGWKKGRREGGQEGRWEEGKEGRREGRNEGGKEFSEQGL
jgi:hypothetical protein